MKRDMELVREILLAVERDGGTPNDWLDPFTIKDYDDEVVSYHVWLLDRAGFLEGMDGSSMDGFVHHPRCLTWYGFEYLETIRDPEVWRKTKESAARVGEFGFDVISAIAKGYIRKKVKDLSEVEIDL